MPRGFETWQGFSAHRGRNPREPAAPGRWFKLRVDAVLGATSVWILVGALAWGKIIAVYGTRARQAGRRLQALKSISR